MLSLRLMYVGVECCLCFAAAFLVSVFWCPSCLRAWCEFFSCISFVDAEVCMCVVYFVCVFLVRSAVLRMGT